MFKAFSGTMIFLHDENDILTERWLNVEVMRREMRTIFTGWNTVNREKQ